MQCLVFVKCLKIYYSLNITNPILTKTILLSVILLFILRVKQISLLLCSARTHVCVNTRIACSKYLPPYKEISDNGLLEITVTG